MIRVEVKLELTFCFFQDDERHLDSLCFQTLIPKYQLEDYVSCLESQRLVAIKSELKFGKTYLASKLAQFISKKYAKIYFSVYSLCKKIFQVFLFD